MYQVLLVDDERVILEGISAFVDWAKLGTNLAGTARNGVEAWEWIQRNQPDIVISDIRMPGMDGLQLVERVWEQQLPIRFILLSGYSEFEYARNAMRYGVKHYLLKPCNEEMIEKAIAETIRECEQHREKERFQQRIEAEWRRMLPHAKEQLLREFVMNKTFGKREWEQYRNIFGMDAQRQQVRLILFHLDGEGEFEHLFAIKNIAEDILGKAALHLSTILGDHVLMLIEGTQGEEQLLNTLHSVKSIFYDYYKIDTTIAVSESGELAAVRKLYKQTLECLNQRFYLGEGSLITKADLLTESKDAGEELSYDEDRLCLLVKSGIWTDVQAELDDFFQRIAQLRLEAAIVRSYVITLYTAIVRLDPARLPDLISDMAQLDAIDTIQGLRVFLEKTAFHVTETFYSSNRKRQSRIVQKVLEVIDAHLDDPDLSLNSVAKKMLYMNADYLGKLFKKEMGEKFSTYVMRKRMELAIEIMGQMEDIKVFELAEQTGFGDNPQYFSKVFKKYTGYTPSEFKMLSS